MQRSTSPNVAERVLRETRAELLWTEIIHTDVKTMRTTGKTAPLRESLKSLECRAYGDPVHNLNHMHDKPVELTGNFSISLTLKKARERVMQAMEKK